VINDLILSDMRACEPATALCEQGRADTWRLMAYTAEPYSGWMIHAGEEERVPELRLPLPAQGLFNIYLSIAFSIRVRLDTDEVFCRFNAPGNHVEWFWKQAELDDDALIIRRLDNEEAEPAGIAYVRLEPVSDLFRPRRCLIAHNDSHSAPAFTAGRIEEEIEPLRDSDFEYFCWEGGGGVVTWPSKGARRYGEDMTHFPTALDRQIIENLQRLEAEGKDPIVMARDHARKIGLKFLIAPRMEAFGVPPPLDELFNSTIFNEHPEWRCITREGEEIPRMSYAYPEVQDCVLEQYQEVLGYEPDGLSLMFNRGAPYLLYEQPLVDGFKERTGQDPHELDEWDEEWIQYRCDVMTGFMRRVRKLLDELPPDGGAPLELIAFVLNSVPTCRRYGIDVETWAREGLVSIVCPYASAFHRTDRDDEKELELPGFVEALAGTDCRMVPHVMPRVEPPQAFLATAAALYAAGADGLAFWDTNCRMPTGNLRQAIRQSGHRKAVINGEIETVNRVLDFRTIGGIYAGPDPHYLGQGY
jgi:hypothetical protein